MDLRRNIRHALGLASVALVLAAAQPAMAQMSLGGGGGGSGGGSDADREAADAAQQAQAKADAKAAAPPPAIPGAVTDEATATSGHASVDMEPTAALFDAINRGDMTSAKEALGRGADLNGKNVLGQSPLDMAIDLNRNDITFLLLSMRNNEDGPPAASVATAEAFGTAVATTTTRDRHGRIVVKGRSGRLAVAKQPVGAQRYAADGGTAKPDIGFLGFGGS